ncbi:PifA [Serratia marcescens]|uniref:PifA n=1 Tax=Serratia marcescens TaxID=615 RepID=UPI003FA6E6A5
MQQELAQRLLGHIQRKKNLSSRTWFEHMLAELTSPLIDSRTLAECQGLLQFFFDNGDDMVKRYRAHNEWFALHDLDTYSVADRLIQRMLRENAASTMKFLTEQLQSGKAWFWSAEYVRHLLWQHGIAGDRTGHQLEEWMKPDNIVTLRNTFAKRLNSPAITDQLPAFPLLNGYIWAWRDISGIQAVRKWVDRQVQGDEAFLNLLLQLRYHGISTASGHFRALNLTEMTEFLGDIEAVTSRIARIKEAGQFAELVNQVEQSIKRNRFY